jgi:SNF2 family DNA or RNA helicase
MGDSKLFGAITHDPRSNSWVIECEPHVGMRLKRLFNKIDKGQHKALRLSATIENSRELEWFLGRYPMEVKNPDLLHQLANKHREKETILDTLLKGLHSGEPFKLKIPPREYQELAARMWHTVGGYLLADDVGVGKTVSAICGLSHGNMLPALIICPTHLPKQWKEEIERFTDLDVHILTKGTPYNITKNHDGRFPDIVISNYHKLAGWASTLCPASGSLIRSVVWEEAHNLRTGPGSNKYSASRHISDSVEFRIGLSATPTFNYGGEIFHVLDILSPGSLGTYEEFLREWCTMLFNGKAKLTDPRAFGLYARDAGLILRRTTFDVKREVPQVTVVPHYIECDAKAIMAMKGRAIELAQMILRQGQQFRGQKMQAAGELDLRMRQVTGIAKAPYAAEFIKLLHLESKEKIVVFAWHREVIELLREHLKEMKPVLYTGSESASQKEASKYAFIHGDSDAIIISLRSGEGLDGLQFVSHITVHVELDWSPACHSQNIGRVARDGQESPVIAYYLLSDQGSDPVIADKLGLKRQQLEGINNPSQEFVPEPDVDEDYIKKLAEKLLAEAGVDVLPPTCPVYVGDDSDEVQ